MNMSVKCYLCTYVVYHITCMLGDNKDIVNWIELNWNRVYTDRCNLHFRTTIPLAIYCISCSYFEWFWWPLSDVSHSMIVDYDPEKSKWSSKDNTTKEYLKPFPRTLKMWSFDMLYFSEFRFINVHQPVLIANPIIYEYFMANDR